MKIFDSHMHMGAWGSHAIFDRNINLFACREIDSSEKVFAHLEKNQIERAVVVPIYLPDKKQTYNINTLVLETAIKVPDKIVPGLWIDPSPEVQEHLYDTLKMAKANGVYILKTSAQTWSAEYSPDPNSWDNLFKKNMETILDFARSTNSVIQIHTGSHKSDVRQIENLIRFAGRGVFFHLVHMGNTTEGNFYLIPRLREWLDEGLNVVCDTSLSRGFSVRWLFELAANNNNLRKSIMFASDEPWGTFQSELTKVIDAAAGNLDLLEDVLWKNASQFYFR